MRGTSQVTDRRFGRQSSMTYNRDSAQTLQPSVSMSDAFPPKAYIIGAQKAGTTSLAFLLDQHPQIALSTPKEPNFFGAKWDRSLDWYRACFPDATPAAVFLDATTGYAMDRLNGGAAKDTIPRRIHELRPDARFIYVLRDPVERAYSGYWHNVRLGVETRPFRDALAANPGYVSPGCYHAQLRPYLNYFPLEAFHLVRFETLCRDPAAVARECISFLDAHPLEFDFHLDRPKNAASQYTSLGRFIRGVVGSNRRMMAATDWAKHWMPRPLYNLAKSTITREVPALSEDDRQWARGFFEEDLERFRQLTGIDVGSPPAPRQA